MVITAAATAGAGAAEADGDVEGEADGEVLAAGLLDAGALWEEGVDEEEVAGGELD